MDFGNLLTLAVFATAIPILLGVLMAYAIIAVVLGAFLWTGKSIPDDVGITIMASGFVVGTLLTLFWLFVRFVL